MLISTNCVNTNFGKRIRLNPAATNKLLKGTATVIGGSALATYGAYSLNNVNGQNVEMLNSLGTPASDAFHNELLTSARGEYDQFGEYQKGIPVQSSLFPGAFLGGGSLLASKGVDTLYNANKDNENDAKMPS